MAAAVLAGVALLPVSVRGQTTTDPAAQQFDRAERLQSEELFVPALTTWDKFLRDFPNDGRAAKASYNRGFCLFQTKQFDKAQDALRKVIEKYPRGEQLDAAYLYLGMAQYSLGQPAKSEICDTAIQTFDTLAAKFPQSKYLPDALYFRAECLYLRGKKAEAARSYADVAAKYPSDRLAAQALYMAGFAALETGDYAAALRHAQAFLAAHPNDNLAADVMHVAAESQLLLGHLPESEQTYGKLLQKYPNHVDAPFWRVRHAMGLYLQKKYRETIDALDPAAASILAPELVCEAQFLLGSSKLELNEPEAAAKALEAAAAADPKWRRADETRLALAAAYRQAGHLDQAQANLRRLIADFPASPLLEQAHDRLGEYCYLAGDYRGAAEAYQALVTRWPQSPRAPQALYALAAAQLDQKNLVAAERSLNGLLDKSPEAKLAARGRFLRGQVRYQVRKYAEAADDLQTALAADLSAKEKSDARYLLGLCRMALKQYPPAAAAFGQLLEHDPQYAQADTAQYQLAWALSLGGDDAKAAEAFAQLLKKYPQSPRVAEAEYNAGELAAKAKDYAKALPHYFAAQEKAGKAEPAEKALFKLGWCYYQQGDFHQAVQSFQYQRYVFPQGPLAGEAAYLEAESLFRGEKYAEALTAYERWKTFASPAEQAQALLHAAQSAGRLKQWEKSLDWAALCARQFPALPAASEALFEQGSAQQSLGKTAEALALYQQIIDRWPNAEAAARAQFQIGKLQFDQKQYGEASQSFVKVVYGYSFPRWQAEAAFASAGVFEAQGKKKEALKAYQDLIRDYPQSDKVAPAKARVEELGK
jgi:TolA-binding protein